MKLRIAFLQILPTGFLNGNLEKGIKACREAKAKGADIAIFPEMWSCGYDFPHEEASLRTCAISSDSFFVKQFSTLAAELNMAIAITLLEQHEPKPRNTVCLIDRHGQLQYRYSKVHICVFGEEDDEGVLDAGDTFSVADLDTKDGNIKVGSMICYDREFPESARILMLKGAELLLVPNACPMELNRLSQLRGRAYENMLAIATCNYPSPHPDCNGHSTLFDGVVYLPELSGSRDTCVFEADESEGVYIAELDVDMLRDYRRREVWGRNNRRPELYREISDKSYIYIRARNRDLQVIKMDNCDWCNLSEEDKQFQIYESKSWSIFLSDEQDYIGRCILVLKRHCPSLSELTDDEWDELRDLICKVEACLKTVLGATLCNWSCLMNSFYKKSEPDPHLHIHVRPRYDKPVMLNGNTYTDSEFGHHYALNKSVVMPAKDKDEVFSQLKEWLNRDLYGRQQ